MAKTKRIIDFKGPSAQELGVIIDQPERDNKFSGEETQSSLNGDSFITTSQSTTDIDTITNNAGAFSIISIDSGSIYNEVIDADAISSIEDNTISNNIAAKETLSYKTDSIDTSSIKAASHITNSNITISENIQSSLEDTKMLEPANPTKGEAIKQISGVARVFTTDTIEINPVVIQGPRRESVYRRLIRDYLNKALGDEERVEIKLSDMGRALDISDKTIYSHLKVLRQTEFVIKKLRYSTEIRRRKQE
jgi:DNA-binding transcriptional ArsR family regulator